MRERIFVPLGMTTAGFGPMGTPGRVDQPWQHKVVAGKLSPVPPEPRNDNPPAIAPSGQVHCSIGDWARFVGALVTEKTAGGLLKPETLSRLLTPRFGGPYAGGWCIAEADSKYGPVLQHAGSNTMNYCFAVLFPKPRFAVLVATNRGDENDKVLHACGDLANKLVAKYFPKP